MRCWRSGLWVKRLSCLDNFRSLYKNSRGLVEGLWALRLVFCVARYFQKTKIVAFRKSDAGESSIQDPRLHPNGRMHSTGSLRSPTGSFALGEASHGSFHEGTSLNRTLNSTSILVNEFRSTLALLSLPEPD